MTHFDSRPPLDSASSSRNAPIPVPAGLYVHVPFCVRKCRYCAFVSAASADPALHEAFVESVCREILQASRCAASEEAPERGRPAEEAPSRPSRGAPPARTTRADTVFFGGGTPSRLTPGQLGRILGEMRRAGFLPLPPGPRDAVEISLEANPGTVDRASLAALRAAGFNRLSLGAQSFDDDALRFLGRIHTAAETAEAVRAARAAGFPNVSLDLIFGRPGQALAQWEADLRAAADLGVEHVSGYLLTVEPGTPLAEAVHRGEVRPLDDALQAEMLLASADILGAAGLARYEISNYARPGFACRHNIKYWTGAPYLGFGPAAHSFAPGGGTALPSRQGTAFGLRWSNVPDVADYVRRLRAGESPVATQEDLTREQRMFETVFLGLRMARGVDLAAFARAFGEDVDARHGAAARRLVDQGLLERTAGFLRLTRKGLPVADAVMAEFAP